MTISFKRRAVEFGGPGVFKKSALSIRDGGGVFERVLGGGSYKTVLEIGTYRGVGAAFMATLCERVITIDLVRGKLEQNGEAWNRLDFWRHMGVDEKIELRLVVDDMEKRKLVDTLQFDIAFIDGAHDRTVASDFDMTRRCRHVLFHDADDNGPNRSNCVHEFIRTLPSHEVEFMDKIFALWRKSRWMR